MTTIKINKTFATMEECKQWEEENFPNRTYQGRIILKVDHTQNTTDSSVVLDSVMVF